MRGTVIWPSASMNMIALCRSRACSGCEPTMKPGTSCNQTVGMLKASHMHTNCVPLSQVLGSSAPGVEHRVAGHDPDRVPADPGQRGDQRAAEAGLELQHLAVVDDAVDHAVHVVGALPTGGYEVGDGRVGLGVVVALADRRRSQQLDGM